MFSGMVCSICNIHLCKCVSELQKQAQYSIVVLTFVFLFIFLFVYFRYPDNDGIFIKLFSILLYEHNVKIILNY